MAASNYATGELLDRFGISPRSVTIGIGIFFILPGVAWFLTKRWWDKEKYERAGDLKQNELCRELPVVQTTAE
jgi:hypothetical protein